MIHQPFGAGHAIMLGFDAWFRAWTTQEERLVLNAVLYPTGSVIPPTSASAEKQKRALHAAPKAQPLPARSLPRVKSRPLAPAGRPGPVFFTSRSR